MFHAIDNKLVYLPVINPAVNHIAEDNAPRNPYPSGYGAKIPTRHRVRIFGNRWHRVYAACYSNVASLYIRSQGKNILVDTSTLDN